MSLRMQLNWFFLLTLFIYGMNSFALTPKTMQATTFPNGCQAVGYKFQDNALILNELGEQTLYLVGNKSQKTVELQRYEVKETFMAPPLLATLNPNNWGAFASDIGNLNFRCYVQENANTALIDCAKVLDVCQYTKVKFAVSNMGNYWVTVNKPREAVVQTAAKSGIWLYWR